MAQTNSSQSLTVTQQYDAFGLLVSSTGTQTGPFGFVGGSGYQTDASGLMLLGHRYYDPSTGRFLTRDPAKDGRNWYGYTANQPTRKTDAAGQNAFLAVGAMDPEPISKGVLIVVGIGVLVWGIYEAEQVIDVSSPSMRGEPGTVQRGYRKSRRYGPDGNPQADRDWDLSHGKNPDHVHDWPPFVPGGPIPKRGDERPPVPGDPPAPRNNPNYFGGIAARHGTVYQ